VHDFLRNVEAGLVPDREYGIKIMGLWGSVGPYEPMMEWSKTDIKSKE